MRRLGSMRGTVPVCPDGKRGRRVERVGNAVCAIECPHSTSGRHQVGPATDNVHWLVLLPDPAVGTLVVEVRADEVRTIARRCQSPHDVRAFLGLDPEQAA